MKTTHLIKNLVAIAFITIGIIAFYSFTNTATIAPDVTYDQALYQDVHTTAVIYTNLTEKTDKCGDGKCGDGKKEKEAEVKEEPGVVKKLETPDKKSEELKQKENITKAGEETNSDDDKKEETKSNKNKESKFGAGKCG